MQPVSRITSDSIRLTNGDWNLEATRPSVHLASVVVCLVLLITTTGWPIRTTSL